MGAPIWKGRRSTGKMASRPCGTSSNFGSADCCQWWNGVYDRPGWPAGNYKSIATLASMPYAPQLNISSKRGDLGMLIAIVTPVFDDWVSLSELIGALEVLNLPESIRFSLFVVDDGSSEPAAIKCS